MSSHGCLGPHIPTFPAVWPGSDARVGEWWPRAHGGREGSPMCGCPSAAATRPQPSGLKQAQVVFLQFRRLESLNQGHGTKTKVWVGWLLLEAPRPNSLVSDLSRLPEAPTFLGSGPSLHSQPLCFHRLPAPTLIPCPPPETPGMTLGPSEKSPLPCNVTCSQVPGNRVWTSFGVISLPTTCRLPPRGRGSGFTARRWGGQARMASNPHSQPSPWRLQPTPGPSETHMAAEAQALELDPGGPVPL